MEAARRSSSEAGDARVTPRLAKPLKRSDTIWVEPKLIADIALPELTEDGMLRHASFKGLNDDA